MKRDIYDALFCSTYCHVTYRYNLHLWAIDFSLAINLKNCLLCEADIANLDFAHGHDARPSYPVRILPPRPLSLWQPVPLPGLVLFPLCG